MIGYHDGYDTPTDYCGKNERTSRHRITRICSLTFNLYIFETSKKEPPHVEALVVQVWLSKGFGTKGGREGKWNLQALGSLLRRACECPHLDLLDSE